MVETWLSGAKELLHHAEEHYYSKSDFDKRIAFISIDNAVENVLRTFLNLPESVSLVKISRAEQREYSSSFPKLLEGVNKFAKGKLVDIDMDEIEYYHRIRNNIYHDGVGITVEDKKLSSYRRLAYELIESLYGVELRFFVSKPKDEFMPTFFKHWSYLMGRCEILVNGKVEEERGNNNLKEEYGFNLLYDTRVGLTKLADSLFGENIINKDLLEELTVLEDFKRKVYFSEIIEKSDFNKMILSMQTISNSLDIIISSKEKKG